MIYIKHRINTIDALQTVPKEMGAEIDVRYHKNELILHHDPFGHHQNNPESLSNFLEHWHHDGPLILNVKTEGIEKKCIELMAKYSVKNWFFLDLSMPYFVKYARHAEAGDIPFFGAQNLAVRFSEYEVLNYALAFSGMAKWVWVDCFNTYPLTEVSVKKLQDAGFKLCLVSPELQDHGSERISEFKQLLSGYTVDAVCTKRPDIWEES